MQKKKMKITWEFLNNEVTEICFYIYWIFFSYRSFINEFTIVAENKIIFYLFAGDSQ